MDASVLLYAVLAISVGSLFPVQTAINARLAAGVGGPIPATLISFLAGGIALLLVLLATRGWPNVPGAVSLPPWLFVAGGLIGAVYLGMNVFLVPRIGAGAMLALAVAGQLLSAIVIDQFGLFGISPHAASPGRLLGAALVLVGAVLVRFL